MCKCTPNKRTPCCDSCPEDHKAIWFAKIEDGEKKWVSPCLTNKQYKRQLLARFVEMQAHDESLWFEAETAPEAVLQHALRRLHFMIDEATREQMKEEIRRYKIELGEL